MFFSRATSGTCLKAGTTTNIANGDMVTCGANQPRVMPGGNGGGGLGLLMESGRTNLALRSQEFDNASWANFTAGSGTNPTKGSANTDVSPDGTTTAERVTFNATGAADSSGLSQGVMVADAGSFFVFARDPATLGPDGGNIDGGGATGGTFDLAIDKASGQTCATCSYVAGSWTRCYVENVPSKAGGNIYLGNLSSLCGGTTRAAQTPALWGAQAEAGAYGTSYIATSGAVASRFAEDAGFALGSMASATFSGSATIIGEGAPASVRVWSLLFGGSTSNAIICSTSISDAFRSNYVIGGSGHVVDSAASLTPGIEQAVASYYDGANRASCLSGTCTATAGALTLPTGAVSVYVGTSNLGAFQLDGVVKNLCLDPNQFTCH